MKHFTKIFAAIFMGVVTLIQTSCKKTEQPIPTAPDVAAILQNKDWKATAITVSPAMGGITDIYNNFLDACNRDDLFKFNANNIFLYDEGATKCNPADPQTQDGSWNYNSNTKNLFFQLTPPSDEYNMTIKEINDTGFKAEMYETDSGVDYTITWIFSKQ
jgi:hypothetical protein